MGFEAFAERDLARNLLQRAMAGAEDQKAVHSASPPAFPAASAGRDFAGHGQRIQALLAQVHQRSVWRVGNLGSTAHSALRQVEELAASDDAAARSLDALGLQGGGR